MFFISYLSINPIALFFSRLRFPEIALQIGFDWKRFRIHKIPSRMTLAVPAQASRVETFRFVVDARKTVGNGHDVMYHSHSRFPGTLNNTNLHFTPILLINETWEYHLNTSQVRRRTSASGKWRKFVILVWTRDKTKLSTLNAQDKTKRDLRGRLWCFQRRLNHASMLPSQPKPKGVDRNAH